MITRRMLGDFQSALEKTEEEIGEEGKHRGGDSSGEDERVADEGHAAKDERAEAAGADGGSDGGDPNGDDCGGANAGENDGERQRETDPEEDLPAGHAHGFG